MSPPCVFYEFLSKVKGRQIISKLTNANAGKHSDFKISTKESTKFHTKKKVCICFQIPQKAKKAVGSVCESCTLHRNEYTFGTHGLEIQTIYDLSLPSRNKNILNDTK